MQQGSLYGGAKYLYPYDVSGLRVANATFTGTFPASNSLCPLAVPGNNVTLTNQHLLNLAGEPGSSVQGFAEIRLAIPPVGWTPPQRLRETATPGRAEICLPFETPDRDRDPDSTANMKGTFKGELWTGRGLVNPSTLIEQQ